MEFSILIKKQSSHSSRVRARKIGAFSYQPHKWLMSWLAIIRFQSLFEVEKSHSG